MCGIVCVFHVRPEESLKVRTMALEMARRLRHRGPDWSGIHSAPNAVLCHERLGIVGLDSGAQPLVDSRNGNALAVNGEIYNHLELRKTLTNPHDFQTHSDCEVLLYLYAEKGPKFLEDLNGMFAFVLYDAKRNTFLIARDPIGIIPLYLGYDAQGHLWVSSELKGLEKECLRIEEFPPGHYFEGSALPHTLASSVSGVSPVSGASHISTPSGASQTPVASISEGPLPDTPALIHPIRYFNPPWFADGHQPTQVFDPKALRASLEASVRRQLMSEVPFGVLLSGGLDSSLIAGLVVQEMKAQGQDPALLKTFSVGLKDSPDLKAAKKVADSLGTQHHSITFTLQEGLDAISDVVYHLETYDVTTIRAATPMYLMSRKIKSLGIKMILSGEGSDEVFGGYLYFHKAPNAKEFQEELLRKIKALHKYDCLRANKATLAWGVEARVPFLDLEFLNHAMSIDAKYKMCGKGVIEKKILRDSFVGLIPEEVLWRQKEQFSDGVGYGWIDTLKDYTSREISDSSLARARFQFPINPPLSKEAFWYRSLFARHYPSEAAAALVPGGPSVACSTPTALRWDPSLMQSVDPSGRAVKDVHKASD